MFAKMLLFIFFYGMRFGHLYAVQTSERSDWANLNCNVHATPPQLKRHPSHLQASNSFLLTREMLFISNVRFICKIWCMTMTGLFKILLYEIICSSRRAKYHWQAVVGHWVSLRLWSVVGWLIVYQLGILSLSCSQHSQTICLSRWDYNACIGVRTTE